MSVQMEIKGLKSLVDRMSKLPDDMMRATQHTVREWGDYAFNATQEACPVDKGILAASGDLEIKDNGLTVVVKYTAPYAKPVEYGWERTGPIVPVHKQALAWEPGKKGRLLAGAKGGGLVVVKRVVTPAKFEGISFVRVPMRRALDHLDAFWSESIRKLKRGEL